jgi:SAM-dependent methyltransferase
MQNFLKFIARKLLSFGKIRKFICYLRAFYFCKIKNQMKDFQEVADETWKNTLDSNKRIVFNKNINLPKKASLKSVFDVGTSLGGGSTNLLYEAIKKKYNKLELKNLKVLTIGPRAEGEIFNLFAHGFEFRNIIGLDLFSYSPYIKLGDMHHLEFDNEEFDVVIMGWCLAYSNNKEKALSEVKRVLTKNGSIIIGYSVNQKISDEDQINDRGYLVRSPFNQIHSLDNLNDLGKSLGYKMFYSKIISEGLTEKIIYGATK